MKTTYRMALLAALLNASPALAQSDVPSEMSYQAIVTDDSNALIAPTTAASYEVTVRIFDQATGGTLLWSERHVTTIFQGRLSITLGQGQEVPISGGNFEVRPDLGDAFDGAERFAELTVRENVVGAEAKTLAPRQKIVATATALRARDAEFADVAGVANSVAPGGLPEDAIPDGTLTGSIFKEGSIDAGKLGSGNISNTELGRLVGVTSNIQDQLDGKVSPAEVGTALNLKANLSNPRFTGNVGINQFVPQATLHVYGPTDPTVKIQSDGNSEISGRLSLRQLNDSGFDIYYDGKSGATNESLKIESFNGTTSNGVRMTVDQGTGNVGIGTEDPAEAKLVVKGNVRREIPGVDMREFNLNTANTFYARNGLPETNYSIWASDYITGRGLHAYSDARIKKIRGLSDGGNDLTTLGEIEITDYLHKDVFHEGTRPHKKVIAQQIEKVFPQAVSRTTNVIPDIYKKVKMKAGWLALATDLKVGERVRLITSTEDDLYKVLEVKEGQFRTALVRESEEDVIVFGREVDDFRTVDYDAISMLNVSATQELARRLEEKTQEVETLKAALQAMNARMIAIEERVSGESTEVKTVSK